MKANELMIGDWVYGLSHAPRKVQGLRDYNEENVVVADHWVNCKQLEPIPLTEEMLTARFKKVTEHKEELFAVNDRFGVKQYPPKWNRGDGWYFTLRHVDIPVAKVNHVHELQHALHLCGLTELADNFKV